MRETRGSAVFPLRASFSYRYHVLDLERSTTGLIAQNFGVLIQLASELPPGNMFLQTTTCLHPHLEHPLSFLCDLIFFSHPQACAKSPHDRARGQLLLFTASIAASKMAVCSQQAPSSHRIVAAWDRMSGRVTSLPVWQDASGFLLLYRVLNQSHLYLDFWVP